MTAKRDQASHWPAQGHVSTGSTSAVSRHSLDVNANVRSRPASPAPSEHDDDKITTGDSLLRQDWLKASKQRAGRLKGNGRHDDLLIAEPSSPGRSTSSLSQLQQDGTTPTILSSTLTGTAHTTSNQARRPAHPLASSSNLSSGQSTPLNGKPGNSILDTRPVAALMSSYRDDQHDSERSPLLSVEVDRPSTPSIQQREYLRIPHDYDVDFNIPSFISTERGGLIKPPTLRSRIRLQWSQFWANAISTAFLLFIVIWALTYRSLCYILATIRGRDKSRSPRPWDDPARWKQEKLVRDVKYYARTCGYDIIDQVVTTEDGYHLRVHKVVAPSQIGKLHSDGRGGFPVIIQHGLFQSSGSFVTSEERSLAFWLAEHGGYQVYLTNNRAVFDMGHTSLKRSDPRL